MSFEVGLLHMGTQLNTSEISYSASPEQIYQLQSIFKFSLFFVGLQLMIIFIIDLCASCFLSWSIDLLNVRLWMVMSQNMYKNLKIIS